MWAIEGVAPDISELTKSWTTESPTGGHWTDEPGNRGKETDAVSDWIKAAGANGVTSNLIWTARSVVALGSAVVITGRPRQAAAPRGDGIELITPDQIVHQPRAVVGK